MYGIVLWSDWNDRQAVIWCEDQGDLAYCRQTSDFGLSDIHAGDWVQFDMTQNAHQRFAHNPRLVVEGRVNPLSEHFGKALTMNERSKEQVSADRRDSKIVELSEMFDLKVS